MPISEAIQVGEMPTSIPQVPVAEIEMMDQVSLDVAMEIGRYMMSSEFNLD